MSLEQKHSENIESANLLLQNEKYNAVPHCSYYSVFRFMKHTLKEKYPKAYEEFQQNSKGRGSHKVLVNSIKEKMDAKSKNIFNNRYKQLKKYRLLGDYEDDLISVTEAGESIALCGELLQLLRSSFFTDT